jgi:hypothetical protein
MREYQRTTRECSFNALSPEIITAIRKYTEKNAFGDIEANILICIETSSEKIKQGFFSKVFGGGNYAVKMAIVVTSERILWATVDNKNATSVLAARLNEIEVKDFSSDLVEDCGLEIFGLISGFSERATAFIGLGEEDGAQKLRHILKESAEIARRK